MKAPTTVAPGRPVAPMDPIQYESNAATSVGAISWSEHLRRFRRRVVTIPALAMIASCLFALLPLLLVATTALDLVRPRRPWARSRAVLSISWIVLCEVVGVVVAFLVWIALLMHRNRERFVRHNAHLQRVWTNALFAGARRIFAMKLELEGELDEKDGPLLVLVRHASLVDTVLTAAVFANRHDLRLRYVLKSELLGDPCIDIVGHRLQNAFVSRGADTRRDVEKIELLTAGLGSKDGVLIYPEGTRFSQRKLERIRARLAPDPIAGPRAARFQNVLPPRLGGTLALLESMSNTDVVIVSHTGLEGAASLGDFWKGELVGKTLRVHVRRVPQASIPRSKAERTEWLMERWHEVDDWVGKASAMDADAPSKQSHQRQAG